jgi:hypothetical protein
MEKIFDLDDYTHTIDPTNSIPSKKIPYGPVWQGSGSSKNSSGSVSSGGAAFLMELKPFWKTFGKTASPGGLRL